MTKLSGIAYEPHPVTPERKKELHAQGLRVVDAIFKPADHFDAPEIDDGFPPDADLRDAIKAATGKAPGPRVSREKLIEQYQGIEA